MQACTCVGCYSYSYVHVLATCEVSINYRGSSVFFTDQSNFFGPRACNDYFIIEVWLDCNAKPIVDHSSLCEAIVSDTGTL